MEMQDKDRPPREIWLDDDALEAHFNMIEARRNDGSGSEDVPDLEQNEMTKGLR